YYLVTGRHYPLIAGNSCYYQQLAATNGYYLLVAANCYLYVLGRMLTYIIYPLMENDLQKDSYSLEE
ncbi:MAG: hypothetical protein IKZ37_00150, partial [Bacteroidaceae bacterium]|nr:hypothetical protein [Bacteroidaceae bacterium]